MQRYLVITGGSRGIGRATAELFIEKGWAVINISRQICDVNGVQNFSVDLSQAQQVNACAESLSANIPSTAQICLVHNAAMSVHDHTKDVDEQIFAQVLQTNVISASILNKQLLPKMAKGSSIIYIGSTLSEKAVANYVSYVTSKHAVVGMMRATCQDLFYTGIHTCCICPGFTDTEMLHENLGYNSELLHDLKKRMAADRLVRPEEIASFIYYCANNPVINGSVLHANLGQLEQ